MIPHPAAQVIKAISWQTTHGDGMRKKFCSYLTTKVTAICFE